jgi:signal transduction histidine kinase
MSAASSTGIAVAEDASSYCDQNDSLVVAVVALAIMLVIVFIMCMVGRRSHRAAKRDYEYLQLKVEREQEGTNRRMENELRSKGIRASPPPLPVKPNPKEHVWTISH